MKIIDTPTPEQDDDDFISDEEFDLYTQDVTRTASSLAHFLGIQQERENLDNIVFSLEQSLADAHAGSFEFPIVLRGLPLSILA